MNWKSKKDGTHFNTDKKKRDSSGGYYEITGVDVKSDFEPMYDDNEKFAEDVRKDFEKDLQNKQYLVEKRNALIMGLDDADRRFNIAISRMSEITNRLHELEVQRNNALRKEFLSKEIENHPEISDTLIKEFDSIDADKRDILVYEEVAKGYRSMSRRKNELEEERNQYVREIEELDRLLAK